MRDWQAHTDHTLIEFGSLGDGRDADVAQLGEVSGDLRRARGIVSTRYLSAHVVGLFREATAKCAGIVSGQTTIWAWTNT